MITEKTLDMISFRNGKLEAARFLLENYRWAGACITISGLKPGTKKCDFFEGFCIENILKDIIKWEQDRLSDLNKLAIEEAQNGNL